MTTHEFIRSHGILVARILIGALFVSAGMGKIGANFAGVSAYIGSVGLPFPEILAALTVLIEIGGGLMLILGWRTTHASAALIGFTALASGIFHHPGMWSPENPIERIMFMKNMAIIGGLIYVFSFGKGTGWSLVEDDKKSEA